ncbi:MAG: hypothetical protein DI586_05290 [Micavibrio aeruginosavorus]|uniref:Uncharacterized protein n=1 Tax=Micavibrio aeruginosavorus TaxID=349221 RepID=A0A2W5FNJ1_9BACT|nr:MAG: hypothetical protein DI586_05290 [Micavibrio aeruginosavorus]
MLDLCDEILNELADEIQASTICEPEPIMGDRWLLASLLQKAIRRGDTQTAKKAAASLWRQDRNSVFRRLITIAPEDIGVGDLDAVVKTFLALTSSDWRKKVGELKVILFLVGALCEAHKNRLSEEIYTQIEKSPELAKVKRKMVDADDIQLMKTVKNQRSDLNKRCMAAWLLLGTRKYPSDFMPGRGPSSYALSTLRDLPISSSIMEPCLKVLPKTQWPLAGFLLLIAHKMQTESFELVEIDIPATPNVEGIPIYALDTFTRTGQASFRKLRSAIDELREFSLNQIGLAVFYLEGRNLNKYMVSPFLNEMQWKGEYADIYSSGLCDARYIGLKTVLTEHWETLQQIRSDILKHTLLGGSLW